MKDLNEWKKILVDNNLAEYFISKMILPEDAIFIDCTNKTEPIIKIEDCIKIKKLQEYLQNIKKVVDNFNQHLLNNNIEERYKLIKEVDEYILKNQAQHFWFKIVEKILVDNNITFRKEDLVDVYSLRKMADIIIPEKKSLHIFDFINMKIQTGEEIGEFEKRFNLLKSLSGLGGEVVSVKLLQVIPKFLKEKVDQLLINKNGEYVISDSENIFKIIYNFLKKDQVLNKNKDTIFNYNNNNNFNNKRKDYKDKKIPLHVKKKEVVCFHCNEIGHFKRDCPMLKEKKQLEEQVDNGKGI